jgi:hypothetical protein
VWLLARLFPGRRCLIPSCRQKSNIVILSEAKNLDSSLRFAPFRMTALIIPV